MNLTEEQLERYSRHLVLDTIGRRGQEKIMAGKVLVIGTGGLGSPVSLYLAAAGVGTLGIVDSDVVDLSNLQRQLLHTVQDIGRPKVLSAREKINRLNPDINVVAYHEKVDAQTLADVISDREYDFIIDATDNFPSKFLINDTCVLLKKPFSHAGVIRFQGQTMTYVPGKGPCYRCLFEEPPQEGVVPSSKEVGILGAAAGVIGTIQATEALKYLLGAGTLLTGTLLTYDGLTMTFRRIPVSHNPQCPACGNQHASA